MNLPGASTCLGAYPAREINMDRMNSTYLTGLSSESPIESLIVAHKIEPFEVQGVKLRKLFFLSEHIVFRQNNWAADQWSATYAVSNLVPDVF